MLILRALVLAGAWWALTSGAPSGLGFGVATVALAVLVSSRLPAVAPPRWRPIGLLLFAAKFLGWSVLAGLQVARLVFAWRCAPRPILVTYSLRLPAGAARNLFLGALGLTPGTFPIRVDGHELLVHVLDDVEESVVQDLARLEAVVGRALGEPLGKESDA